MSSALYNCRNIMYTNCRRFSVSGLSINNISRNFTKFKEFRINSPVSRNVRIPAIRRCLSTQPDPDSSNKPAYTPLMEYPELTWPGFFQMVKCWLTFRFNLPGLDKDFDLNEFIDGSQHALYMVSAALSREDYDRLDGLITPEAIEILKKNISKMSADQKREIELKKEELFFFFPWEISIRDGPDGSSKIVEILMVFHLLRNWQDPNLPNKVLDSDSAMQKLELMQRVVNSSEYAEHTIVCNYRFIREFGTADSSWFINLVNQFKLTDIQ